MADGGEDRREFHFTTRDFERVRKLIHAKAGISLAGTKEEMVYSRLSRRLRALRLSDFRTYLDQLEHRPDGDEWQNFTNALTTNLTSFFREAHHFDAMKAYLRKLPRGQEARIWCSAASTGEEPYSIAMTACEAYESLHPPVSILATDIDTQVLAAAERGIYASDRLDKMSLERKRRFFLKGSGPTEGKCRVIDPLRQMVRFRPLNLLDPRYPMPGPFDIIFCRNVMIYFDKPTQLAVLRRMISMLTPEGLFIAGHSESFFQAGNLIRSVGRTVYQRAESADGGR